MKNTIKYYYNLNVSNIRQTNDIYYLVIDNNNYILCPCILEDLEKIEKYLINNYNYHNLVKTVNNDKIIIYNNNVYALFKINTIIKPISIDNIIESNLLVNNNDKEIIDRWINMWSLHVDYIEDQMNEMNSNYDFLYKIVYYYIGLAENAIQFLKSIKKEPIPLYITHKRIKINTNLVELYNPAFLVFDTRVRDTAEYFKDVFFKGDLNLNEISRKIFIILNNYSNIEKNMFFARMLYPTYFFDLYDEILLYNKNESMLDSIVSKSEKYEELLKEMFSEIKKTTYIDNIDWLII